VGPVLEHAKHAKTGPVSVSIVVGGNEINILLAFKPHQTAPLYTVVGLRPLLPQTR
jgi:hypothetical protein